MFDRVIKTEIARTWTYVMSIKNILNGESIAKEAELAQVIEIQNGKNYLNWTERISCYR